MMAFIVAKGTPEYRKAHPNPRDVTKGMNLSGQKHPQCCRNDKLSLGCRPKLPSEMKEMAGNEIKETKKPLQSLVPVWCQCCTRAGCVT